ncbi:MAG TPA: inner-membrane translocator [Ktedonobacterales bacterium]|jgi:D-xylose transport system permease protein
MSNILENEPAQPTGSAVAHMSDASSMSAAAVQVQRLTFVQRLRGDLGFLPVLLTLLVIGAYFQVTSPDHIFLNPRNLSNIVLEIATIGTLALGVVPVLLLGEIDLSLASVSTFCASVMAVLAERKGVPAGLALVAGILSGTVVGLINGFFIAVLRVPSFIVTLAGFIAYAGLVLKVLEPNTTLIVRSQFINGLAGNYLPDTLGIGLPTAALVLYVGSLLLNYFTRRQAGLRTVTIIQLLVQIVIAVAVVEGAVSLFESYQGVPESGAILIGLILIMWLMLTKTGFGRHIYAVGGNAEAARRTGINVTGVRLTVFALSSTLAAIGGILATSRETAVASQIPSTLLLDAIAAAVIGGVSLFGGRGSAWAVILGALIIGSLENGLALLGGSQATQEIVEGSVLLFAVTVDAFVRRANTRSGR